MDASKKAKNMNKVVRNFKKVHDVVSVPIE